ncbi:DoxX family protein [uncultured Roseivirga sp.]|uniref:DoxX family protein n=1 Tax=uncultured Roseivirga sp. TaxID=543088 RepID=UPI0030DC92E4|tara:strand:+ start:31641 stop:32039 length:399 start_codon:yes stop_codon:yes gene_type:complete
MKNKKSKKIVSWILRLLAALIMLQTLFFKFTGAEESIYIFTQVGMEPWGRYMTGIVELIASVLLLTNRYEWGALLGLGTISGAIFFHLTKLGIEVQGDGGYLFALAIVVFVSCMTTLLINFPEIKTKYLPNK